MEYKTRKQIAAWLASGAILVLSMVVIGGITRLTHSGLSIVTWQPIKGILPPLNEAQWQVAFEGYKKIPEYQKVHHYFTLQDFKHIFFWEYLHRMLGRFIGLVFILPFVYFWLSGKLKSTLLKKRLLLIFLLGGLQGFVGWYMVKSGLVKNTSVDHVRLALHMSVALIVLSVIYWTILELLFPGKQYTFNHDKLQKWLLFGWGLVIIQIIYGGLTAGLKAGHVFPTYPKMGKHWFPPIAQNVYQKEGLMSLVDFPPTVQFIHRWLGFVILLFLFYFYMKFRSRLNKMLARIILVILVLISLQYTFGILILLLHVPISLAVTHQLTAFLIYLSILTALFFTTKHKNTY